MSTLFQFLDAVKRKQNEERVSFCSVLLDYISVPEEASGEVGTKTSKTAIIVCFSIHPICFDFSHYKYIILYKVEKKEKVSKEKIY